MAPCPGSPADRERWVVVLRYTLKSVPRNARRSDVAENSYEAYPQRWIETLLPETLELVK